jgi:hypothetical protein
MNCSRNEFNTEFDTSLMERHTWEGSAISASRARTSNAPTGREPGNEPQVLIEQHHSTAWCLIPETVIRSIFDLIKSDRTMAKAERWTHIFASGCQRQPNCDGSLLPLHKRYIRKVIGPDAHNYLHGRMFTTGLVGRTTWEAICKI